MMALSALALVAAILKSNRRGILAGTVLVAFVLTPVVGFGVVFGMTVWAVARRRPRSSSHGDDEAVLAELTALAREMGFDDYFDLNARALFKQLCVTKRLSDEQRKALAPPL